jgi:hypothetical protein
MQQDIETRAPLPPWLATAQVIVFAVVVAILLGVSTVPR